MTPARSQPNKDSDSATPARDRGRGFPISARSKTFLAKFFPGTSQREWNDWRWQLRHSIRDRADLERILILSKDERRALSRGGRRFPFKITPYYASLLDRDDGCDPLRRTVVPVDAEYQRSADELDDPLAEDANSPVPGIVHRYPDRVLFLVTDYCPVYCRYCTRSRLVGGNAGFDINQAQWQRGIDYIAATPAIRDVLISGGDPLVYDDAKLEWLLKRLRAITHVDMIRIGTKVPVVMPMRIRPAMTRMLKRYHPVYMSLHIVHPREITAEAAVACNRLADAGIPLGAQTVLLKDVNDDAGTMTELMHELLKVRVRPYYLLQCDPVVGTAHFRTPVQDGLDIIRALRGHTSGYAVPHYIIDLPEGGGKISLVPNSITSHDENGLEAVNYQGISGYRYPDFTGP